MEKETFSLGNAYKSVCGKENKQQKYEMNEINLSYDNDSHSIIVNHILKDNKKGICLDVGCNTGAIGNCLSKFGYKVDGIEYDKYFFEQLKANNFYNSIYNFSVSNFDSKEFIDFYNSNVKYDYIIFADVLEHLVNPAEVLYKLSLKLKQNGKIIVSIPNIMHIDIISNLIDGKFNYNDEGILDNTHLRFFTDSSFIDMINNIEQKEKINYAVKKIGVTKVMPTYVDKKNSVLFNLKNNINDYSVIQYLYEISISKNKQKRVEKNNSYYDFMNNKYNQLQMEIEKKDSDISELNRIINDLKNENSILKDNYNKVISSKRYKLISNIAKIFKK